jgi:hypothetical protein
MSELFPGAYGGPRVRSQAFLQSDSPERAWPLEGLTGAFCGEGIARLEYSTRLRCKVDDDALDSAGRPARVAIPEVAFQD